MVRTEFGVPILHVPRSVQKELGGGAVLDIGVYCLQFICMVYDGERPESIQATGVCHETGNGQKHHWKWDFRVSPSTECVHACRCGWDCDRHSEVLQEQDGGVDVLLKPTAAQWCQYCGHRGDHWGGFSYKIHISLTPLPTSDMNVSLGPCSHVVSHIARGERWGD